MLKSSRRGKMKIPKLKFKIGDKFWAIRHTADWSKVPRCPTCNHIKSLANPKMSWYAKELVVTNINIDFSVGNNVCVVYTSGGFDFDTNIHSPDQAMFKTRKEAQKKAKELNDHADRMAEELGFGNG
jgi:hypothetical protein